jgi:hypothetical protein
MRLRTPHLCLDVRAEAIYWASANASRRGLEPAAWGRIARDGALGVDEQLARLAAQGIGSEHRCETGVRSAGAQHERATLPALSRGELRAVVRRRSEELAARAGAAQCTASLSARGEQGAALWLVGVDEAESERERETWLRRGFPLARLQSRHLALGQLVRCLAPLAEGEVVAIFDIEPETGTCVLADRAGWIFSREVPLRFMGRGPSARGARSEPTPAALTPDDPSIRVLEGASAAEGESAALATQPIAEEEERDPLEDIAIQAERLATELRRTFRYVEGRIGAQPVSRVILAGELTELIDLGPALGAQLGLPVEVLANGQGDDARPVGGAAVVLGMACAPSASGGNLLAPPVQRALAARRLRRRLQRGLAVAALGAAAAGLAVALEAGSLSLRLDSLERAWAADADARALVAAGQAAAQRASELEHAFAQLDAPQPSAAALLRALSLQVPDEAALQRLRIEPGEQGTLLELTLDASGATMASAAQSVSDFARELAQAPFVRVDVVEPEAEGAPPEPNAAPRVRFRVVGELAAVAPDAGVGGER